MSKHIWEPRTDNRPGFKCAGCCAISLVQHQDWPCEGPIEEEPSSPTYTEKDCRVYYQDLVYEVCRLIDVANGHMPGKGIVCGTAEDPSTQLQQAVTVLIKKSLGERVEQPATVTIADLTNDYARIIDEAAKVLGCSPPDMLTTLKCLVLNFRHANAIVEPLNRLRAEEGSSVTFVCDNPDFNGQPNCAVDVCGSWNDWQEERFRGHTLAECLKAAEEAKAAAEKKPLCETCQDTGQAISMVCYGGMPQEQMGPCPDCNRTAEKGAQG